MKSLVCMCVCVVFSVCVCSCLVYELYRRVFAVERVKWPLNF